MTPAPPSNDPVLFTDWVIVRMSPYALRWGFWYGFFLLGTSFFDLTRTSWEVYSPAAFDRNQKFRLSGRK